MLAKNSQFLRNLIRIGFTLLIDSTYPQKHSYARKCIQGVGKGSLKLSQVWNDKNFVNIENI